MRANAPKAPLLVFGFGNPSRGDDALGPEFVRRAEARFSEAIAHGVLDVLTDYQLQVEHVLDLEGRERVYFVDASAPVTEPQPQLQLQPQLQSQGYSVTRVAGACDASFTTHLLSPAALLHIFGAVVESKAPECWLIAIAGHQFELGAPMSPVAEANLTAALDAFGRQMMQHPALATVDVSVPATGQLTRPLGATGGTGAAGSMKLRR